MLNCFYALINSTDSYAAYLVFTPRWKRVFCIVHFWLSYFALLGIGVATLGIHAIILFCLVCTGLMILCLHNAVEIEE